MLKIVLVIVFSWRYIMITSLHFELTFQTNSYYLIIKLYQIYIRNLKLYILYISLLYYKPHVFMNISGSWCCCVFEVGIDINTKNTTHSHVHRYSVDEVRTISVNSSLAAARSIICAASARRF